MQWTELPAHLISIATVDLCYWFFLLQAMEKIFNFNATIFDIEV